MRMLNNALFRLSLRARNGYLSAMKDLLIKYVGSQTSLGALLCKGPCHMWCVWMR